MSASGRAVTGSALLVAIYLSAAPCFADDAARVRLDYSTDVQSCPDEGAFRRLVDEQLEREAFADDAALTMRVRVTHHGDDLKGSLSLIGSDDEEGAQSFAEQASRCDELVATMSLAAVIAVERLRQKTQSTKTESPKRSRKHAPRTASARPPPGPSRSFGLSTFAGVGVVLDHVPEPSIGTVFGLELARADLQLGLHAEQFAPGYAEGSGGVIKVQLSRLKLGSCYSKWSLAACGVFAVGAMRGTALEASRSLPQTVVFPVAGVSAGWRRPFGHIFELRVEAGLDFALSRPIFALRNGIGATDVWQPSLPGLSLMVGVATRLLP